MPLDYVLFGFAFGALVGALAPAAGLIVVALWAVSLAVTSVARLMRRM